MLRGSSVAALLGVFLVAASCDDNPSGPSDSMVIDGVRYSAAVTEIMHQTSRQFVLTVTLRNTRTTAVTRTYSVECPVRIRLYRLQDARLLYDETKFPCDIENKSTVTIPAGAQINLSSGPRFPASVLGDSLSATDYSIAGVARTEGTVAVEVSAGTYRVPSCVQVGVQTVCT